MYVTNFEACTVSAQAAWPESRKTPLVRQFRQRIGLIHELAQLRTTEEIANDCRKRLGVDELLRRHPFDVHVEQRHTLLHESLGAGKSHAALVRKQFAYGTNTTGAQMIDVVQTARTGAQLDEILHRADEIFIRQNPLIRRNLDLQLRIDLVTTYAAEIVLLRIEKQPLEQVSCIGHRRWIARTQAPVNFFQSLFFRINRIFLEGFDDCVIALKVNHRNSLNSQCHDLAHGRLSKRLKSTSHSDFTVQHRIHEHSAGDLGFVEGLRKLQSLNIIEQTDNLFVGAIT